jgi:pSer/pThr/pTyr-binding forkhead associated (FHA) protein
MVKPAWADMISWKHLFVERKNDEYYIEDTGSTNGTRLNGSNITGKGKYLLKNNDIVDLGGALSLTFRA